MYCSNMAMANSTSPNSQMAGSHHSESRRFSGRGLFALTISVTIAPTAAATKIQCCIRWK